MNRSKTKRSFLLCWLVLGLSLVIGPNAFAQPTAQTITISDFPGEGDQPDVVVGLTSFTVEASANSGVELIYQVLSGQDLIVSSYDVDGVSVTNNVVFNGTSGLTTWTPQLRFDGSNVSAGGGTLRVLIIAPAHTAIDGTDYQVAFVERDIEIERLRSLVEWQNLEETVFGELSYDLPVNAAVARDDSLEGTLGNVSNPGALTDQVIVYTVSDGPGIIIGQTVYAFQQGTVTITATALQSPLYQQSFANQNIVFNNVELGTGAVILDQWNVQNPDLESVVDPTAYNDFAEADEIRVAVGDDGRIVRSDDGIDWTAGVSGVATDLNGVAARGTRATGIITVATNPTIPPTNTNNVDFEEININGVTFSFREVARTETEFTVGGSSAATAALMALTLNLSTIPEIAVATYTANGSNVEIEFDEVGFLGNQFALNASSGGDLTVSGATLTGGDILFVAVGEDATVLSSTDGTNWVDRSAASTIPAVNDLKSITYDSGTDTFIAVGVDPTVSDGADANDPTDDENNDGVIWQSQTNYDGTTAWTERTVPSPQFKGLNAVAVNDSGVAIAVGVFGTIYRNANLAVTPDGWVLQAFGSSEAFEDVVYGAGQFVLVGEGGTIWSSPTGQVWTPQFSNQDVNLNGIAFGDFDGNTNVFVAAGDDGVVVTSLDGKNWIERNTRFPYTAEAVGISDFVFYTVGDAYSILSSPSGQAWTVRDSDQPAQMSDVAFQDNLYVAVGSVPVPGGANTEPRILTSPDGSTWSDNTDIAGLGIMGLRGIAAGAIDNGVTSGNGFVAVGDDGNIATSFDGVTWTGITRIEFYLVPGLVFPFSGNLTSVHFAEGRFVAVGDDRSILTSTDGFIWQLDRFGLNESIVDVTYGNGTWVAVGGSDLAGSEVGTVYVSSTGEADSWNAQFTVNDSRKLNGVTFFEEKFVAVGDEGLIITSSSGSGWTRRDSGTIYDLNSVTSDSGAVVAVGETFTVVSSDDGLTWGAQISGSLNELQGVGVGDGLFVALGDFDLILTSTNALNTGLDDWNLATVSSANTPNVNYVIYENGMYVAVGDGGLIRTSTDGLVWTDRVIDGFTDDLNTVAFGDGVFVAAGSQSILSSVDGINWEVQTTWITPINELAYGKGIFVGAADGGFLLNISIVNRFSGEISLESNQSNYTNDDRDGEDFKGVSFIESSGLFILVGASSQFDGTYIVGNEVLEDPDMSVLATSTDGITWERQFVFAFNETDFLTETLTSAAFGNGQYVIAGTNGTIMAADSPFTIFEDASTDTVVRTEVTIPFNLLANNAVLLQFGNNWNDVIYESGNGNPGFVLVGEGGAMMTSPDGVTWTFIFPGITDNLNGIAYGDLNGLETFIAVGDAGRILNSTDRTNWTDIRPIDATNTLSGFASGNDTLVALGNDGGILRSTDGLNWTKVDAGFTLNFNGAAFGNGNFVGVLDSGQTAFSPDGETWTSVFSGTTNKLNDIAFGELSDVFIAVGDAGVYLTSTDGSFWSNVTSPLAEDLLGVYVRSSENAVGTIEFDQVPSVNDTITIDPDGAGGSSAAVTFTFVSADPEANEIQVLVGIDTVETIASKSVAKLAAGVTEANYLADGDTVTVTFNNAGEAGNDFSISTSNPAAIDVSATLSGGVNELFVAVGENGFIATSPDAETWTTQTPSASLTGRNIYDAAFGNNTFVIVGELGRIATSADGATWTDRNSNLTVDIKGIDFADEQFVAVGKDGSIISSSDGINWIQRPSRTFADLNDIGFSNSSYFAVGAFGTIISSGDFAIKADQTILFPILSDISFRGADISLALGASASSELLVQYAVAGPATVNGDILTVTGIGEITVTATQPGNDSFNAAVPVIRTFSSVDAATKTNQTIDFSATTTSFTFENNLTTTLSATAFEEGTTDPTGLAVNFELVSGPASILDDLLIIDGAGTIIIDAVVAGNDTFNDAAAEITIVVDRAPQTITYSPELPSEVTNGDLPITLLASSTSGSPVTFLLLSGSATLDGNVLTIDDSGIQTIQIRADVVESDNYTSATLESSITVNAPSSGDLFSIQNTGFLATLTNNLNGVAFVNQEFIAVGDGGLIISSADGITWNQEASGPSVLNSVAYGSGVYAAVGSNGDLLNSTDGDNWSLGTSGVTTDLNEVGYINSRFVAIGNAGTLITSNDGLSWTVANTGSASDLSGIVFANDMYVIVGSGGSVLTSSDLVQFNEQTIAPSNFNDVTFAESQFVIVANNNTLLTSPDAVAWTVRSSPSATLTAIADGAGRFVTAGPGGVIALSEDAITWKLRNSPVTENLNDIAFSPETFVTVGANGTILTSGEVSSLTPQTITINTPVNDQTSLGTFNLDASSDSGLPVTYTLIQGNATIDNTADTITVNSDGVIIYRVSQAGDSTFFPAEDVEETFSAGSPSKITFGTIETRGLNDGAFTLGGSVDNAFLTVSYEVLSGPATVAGALLTPTGVGTVTVRAFVDGRPDIADVEQSFSVVAGSQSIFTTTEINRTFGDEPFTLVATADSGQPVTFNIISGAELISLNTTTNLVTINGAGTAVVQATAPASGSLPSASTEITITIAQAAQTLQFFNDPVPVIIADETLDLSIFSLFGDGSTQEVTGLDVELEIVDSVFNSATFGTGTTLQPNGVPDVITIEAQQPGNANFLAATPVQLTVIATVFETQPFSGNFNFNGGTIGSDDTLVLVGENGNIFTDAGGNGVYDIGVVDGEQPNLSLQDVAFGNGIFVAVGNGGTIIASTDGVNWTNISESTTRNFRAIIFAENRFVAIGLGGLAFYTEENPTIDDLSFEEVTLPGIPTASPKAITYGNGTFVIVGAQGAAFNSTDGGLTWTRQSTGSIQSMNGVAFGNSIFLAVGNQGEMSRSPDGVDWELIIPLPTAVVNEQVLSVAFGDGLFTVVIANGVSAQGSALGDNPSFTLLPPLPGVNFRDIFFIEDRLVAVGSDGLAFATAAPNASATTLFVNAESVEDDWMSSDWFGNYSEVADTVYFHTTLGWLIADVAASDSAAAFYSPSIGWFWTTSETFPWIYVPGSQKWYYCDPDSKNPIWLYNPTSGWTNP